MAVTAGTGQGPSSARPQRSGAGVVFGEIFLAAAFVTIPLTVLTAVLLGLIFSNLVKPTSLANSGAFQAQLDSNSYYIDFSATQLTTIASWCSSVAPLLSGGVMALFFFHISSLLKTRSERAAVRELPTPLQLSLLVGIAGGTIGPLWRWLKYMFLKKRETSVSVLRLGTSILILSLFLSYVIWAADTWLHVVTSTVILDQINESSLHSFGRGFAPACNAPTTRLFDSCSLNPAATNIFIVNGTEGLRLLANQSTYNQIITSTLNDSQIQLITDLSLSPNTDFSADTLAVGVKCKPITTACGMIVASGASTPFECSDSFKGDVTSQVSCANSTGEGTGFLRARGLFATFTYDEELKVPFDVGNATSNPFYFGIAGAINGESGQDLPQLFDDPDLVQVQHGGQGIVINCEVTLYDMQYKYSKGSVVSASISRTNTTDTNTIVAPFAVGQYTDIYVESALRVAALSNSSQEIVDKFASGLGKVVLAASAGVMRPTQNLDEQTRMQVLVTRIPKAPLFTLVVANLLYVVFGLILVCVICAGNPREAYPVKQRLTVEGLAATAFESASTGLGAESTEDFFEESKTPGHSKRVGLHYSEQNGWQLST